MNNNPSKTAGLNPVSLAAGLLLAAGLYLPLFFASPAYSYVLGLDRIVAEGATLANGLGGGVQMLLAALRFDSPTGLRATGLLLHLLTVAALAIVLMRRGVHPAGAGLASSLYAVHVTGLAVVLPLDNLGVGLAMLAAVSWQLPGVRGGSTAGLIVPALLHPVGLCAWPLRWLLGDDSTRAELRAPVALALAGLTLVGWTVAGQQDLAQMFAFAGHSWLQVVAGWRFNELLPWSSDFALARFSAGDIGGSLSGLFLGISAAIALLARFGQAMRDGARAVLPVLIVAPLLPGLVGVGSANAPNPLFVLPMVVGLAVLIGRAVSRVVTNLLNDNKLTPAAITVLVLGAVLLAPNFITARNQTSLFADGRTFWNVHLRREPDSAQAQLALARATLFWSSDPREMANRDFTVRTSQAGAAKLIDLFEPETAHDVPLTVRQEAEAHWLLAAALTRTNLYAPGPLLEHLTQAVELAPEQEGYAEFLTDATRAAEEYEQQIKECAVADPSTREQRRVALMEQASGLMEVGAALHPPRIWPPIRTKYEDAMRCDPEHPDAYSKLAGGYLKMGEFATVLEVLDRAPPGLATHSSLLRQRAYATGHLPPPDNLEKGKLPAYRSAQQRAAALIWAEVLRHHPDRSEPWFHLAQTAFRYDNDALRAKAYLERGLASAPERGAAPSIRRLRDAIDRKVPKDALIPPPTLPKSPTADAGVDAGPAADGGTP
jgi:tetratricopeptide (TPR) repeat protein